jgi:hypothetical protein
MSTQPIPRGRIEWLVNRYHVGTAEAEVRADIEARVLRSPAGTAAFARRCGAYAIRVHRANRDLYRTATGSL